MPDLAVNAMHLRIENREEEQKSGLVAEVGCVSLVLFGMWIGKTLFGTSQEKPQPPTYYNNYAQPTPNNGEDKYSPQHNRRGYKKRKGVRNDRSRF